MSDALRLSDLRFVATHNNRLVSAPLCRLDKHSASNVSVSESESNNINLRLFNRGLAVV